MLGSAKGVGEGGSETDKDNKDRSCDKVDEVSEGARDSESGAAGSGERSVKRQKIDGLASESNVAAAVPAVGWSKDTDTGGAEGEEVSGASKVFEGKSDGKEDAKNEMAEVVAGHSEKKV